MKSDKKRKWINYIILLVVVCIAVSLLYFKFFKKERPDTEFLVSKLEKSSELTTAKLTYKGMYHYQDSGVPIWNKSDFYIVYTAVAKAGVDLSDAKVTSDDEKKEVKVVLPKATVQECNIEDPEKNVEFHDVGFALFNFDGRDDENKAISRAESDAKDKVTELGILEFADTTAIEVVNGLLQNAVPEDYTLTVETAQ